MPEELDIKAFGPLELKDAEQGEVTAVVATLGVVDKDGDVILPGAVPAGGAKVKVSGYNHDIVREGAAPVGKGMITEVGDKLIFQGKFFLSTTRGREAFHMVREMGADGEWSFGFPRRVKTANLTDEWKVKGARRLITGILPMEASPVIVGAGVGTHTVSAKAADQLLESGNPYDLVKRGDEYCVLKKDSGETIKCHATHEEAIAHFQALEMAYQQEKQAKVATPTDEDILLYQRNQDECLRR